MIALNLLIGPPLFRIALTRVGEASTEDNRGVNVVIVDNKEDEEREEERE